MPSTRTTTGPHSTKSEHDIKRTVKLIYAAIQADYGDAFTRRFQGDGDERLTPNQWMIRLYSRVKDFPAECIVNGYDAATRKSGGFPPSIPEIEAAAREAYVETCRAKAAEVPAPRFTGGIAGYVEHVLKPNARSTVALAALESIKDILSRDLPKDGRGDRLDLAVAMLEETIEDQRKAGKMKIGTPASQVPLCGRSWCDSPGALSHSLTGSGPWYCKAHWRKKA